MRPRAAPEASAPPHGVSTMARPASRRRRGRDDDAGDDGERPGRRGRGSAAPAANPMTIVMGGVVALLVIGVAIAMMGGEKEPPKKIEPLGPATPAPVAPPSGSKKEPPKPLTPEEIKEVEEVFAGAAEEMAEFRRFVKAGWALKNGGDNDGANDEWVQAKKRYQKALGIANEVMEDEDRFPLERQQLHMKRFLDRMGDWAKEMSDVPKVNVK